MLIEKFSPFPDSDIRGKHIVHLMDEFLCLVILGCFKRDENTERKRNGGVIKLFAPNFNLPCALAYFYLIVIKARIGQNIDVALIFLTHNSAYINFLSRVEAWRKSVPREPPGSRGGR